MRDRASERGYAGFYCRVLNVTDVLTFVFLNYSVRSLLPTFASTPR